MHSFFRVASGRDGRFAGPALACKKEEFSSGTPQCTRFRSAPSRSRASPYAKRKGVWRPHASMGRHIPFLFAHCSLPARTLYQQFFDLYSPKAGGRGDFYRQILRLVQNLGGSELLLCQLYPLPEAYALRQRDLSGFHVLLFRTSWFVRNGHFEFTGLRKIWSYLGSFRPVFSWKSSIDSAFAASLSQAESCCILSSFKIRILTYSGT